MIHDRLTDPNVFGDQDATMAGFIVWLAGQPVPSVQRYFTHDEVERFLRWSAARPWRAGNPRLAAHSYIGHMRGAGVSEVLLTDIGASLRTFLDYCYEPEPAVRP